MNPDEVRTVVRGMWLTTPEAELLGCIALALAEILESMTMRPLELPTEDDRVSAA